MTQLFSTLSRKDNVYICVCICFVCNEQQQQQQQRVRPPQKNYCGQQKNLAAQRSMFFL